MYKTKVEIYLDNEEFGDDFEAIIKAAAYSALSKYLSDNLEFYEKSVAAREYLEATVDDIIKAGGKGCDTIEEIQADIDKSYRDGIEIKLERYHNADHSEQERTEEGLWRWLDAHPESEEELRKDYGEILDEIGYKMEANQRQRKARRRFLTTTAASFLSWRI